MYDDLSADYDRFVNWPARLAVELPFLQSQLQQVEAHRVLDAACGTGHHAIALAERGYEVTGADLSSGMIDRARANGADRGADVRFAVAGFGELHDRLGTGFDAVLCLGNSLPHVLIPSALVQALSDFAACLEPGGLLLVQNRNFDRVLADHQRWMTPQTYREGPDEWLFLRFYDFEPGPTLSFNLVTLRRHGEGDWSQQVSSTRLMPQRQRDVETALTAARFLPAAWYGDMEGDPFDPEESPNLIVTARKE